MAQPSCCALLQRHTATGRLQNRMSLSKLLCSLASHQRRCNRASKHKGRRGSYKLRPQGMQPFMCPSRAPQGAGPLLVWASAHPAHTCSIWRQAAAEQVYLPRLHQQGRLPLCSALRLWGQQHTGQVCRANVIRRDAGAVNANGACLGACRPEKLWDQRAGRGGALSSTPAQSVLCCAQAGCEMHRCHVASLTEAADCSSLMQTG